MGGHLIGQTLAKLGALNFGEDTGGKSNVGRIITTSVGVHVKMTIRRLSYRCLLRLMQDENAITGISQ